MRTSGTAALALYTLIFAALATDASQIDEARELQRQGKLEAANDVLVAAEKQYRAAGDSINLARALGVHADISLSRGHYEETIQQANEALHLRSAAHDTSQVGDDYNTIGLAYEYLGDYPAALEQYRKAFDADRSHHDPDGQALRLNNIGNIFYFQGRYSDASHSYDDAMSLIRAAPGAAWAPSKEQLTVANLAVLYQRLGQEQHALTFYRRLADPSQFDSARNMSPSERARLLLNQGSLYRRLGDPVKALELYRAAQRLFDGDRYSDGEIGALRNIGIVLAADLNDVPGALEAFTQALDLSTQSNNRRGVVQNWLYRGELYRRQGRMSEAAADFKAALNDAKSVGLVEEQWKSLYGLGQIAESAGRRDAAEQSFRDAIAIIESVRAGLRLVPLRTDFLADKRDVYDSLIALRLDDPHASPEDIFQWMERSRARTLLDRLRGKVELVDPRLAAVQSHIPPGTTLAEYWLGPDRGAAVWVTRDGSGLVRFSLPIAKEGAELLKEVPLNGPLIVVPDGPLGTMPFETLRVPRRDQLLIEQCEVSYLPSARFVGRRPHSTWKAPWSTEVVAMADPPVTSNPFDDRWEALPASAAEARAIAQIMPGRARIHVGADMQKRYLLNTAPSQIPVWHLATHAMVDAENPDRSRILLANDYLVQEEVYDLDLTGVSLVTLSACDTAQGKFVRGENVQAFSQAFLAAGAESVVTSLWRVADGPTGEFMKQFYYALSRGQSKGAALRSAKLQFLHSHSELAAQRYWAAFVLSGDGSAPVPRPVPWGLCLIAAALLIVIPAIVMAVR